MFAFGFTSFPEVSGPSIWVGYLCLHCVFQAVLRYPAQAFVSDTSVACPGGMGGGCAPASVAHHGTPKGRGRGPPLPLSLSMGRTVRGRCRTYQTFSDLSQHFQISPTFSDVPNLFRFSNISNFSNSFITKETTSVFIGPIGPNGAL